MKPDHTTADQQDGPEVLVSRSQLATILTSAGFRTSPSTLAKLAVNGSGPEFIKFGRHVLYDPSTALMWAKRRSSVHMSTSDDGRNWARAFSPHAAARSRSLDDAD